MTNISLFDYSLPEDLIAQHPLNERDASRLLVINRSNGEVEDKYFSDLSDYLRKGDVLVLNDSRVIKARLKGKKTETGANIEIFLTKKLKDSDLCDTGKYGERWEALARPAKRLHPGDEVLIGTGLKAYIVEKNEDGFVQVDFFCDTNITEAFERMGQIPLPPYIHRENEEEDTTRYQTVYAENPGSVAAPTAGLHFTEKLLDSIRAKGVEVIFLTLHVGLGTFRPVSADSIENHKMHSEYYSISEESRIRINLAKKEGRRLICVGTTSMRTIESAGVFDSEKGWYIPEQNLSGDTDIFIYPGSVKSFMTDALITNFHLPKSTLLMLVSAFYNREKILEIYRYAIENRYRFFSYGDAMMIL